MFHHFLIYFFILLFFPVSLGFEQLLFFIGLLLFLLNGVWISIFLGIFSAKYRDSIQIIVSLLQISMFITPIFWPPDLLESKGIAGFLVVNANILHHYVDLMRSPLLENS